jgi:hypothetical protein
MQLDTQIRSSSGNRCWPVYSTVTGGLCQPGRVALTLALTLFIVIIGVGGATAPASASQFNPPKLDGYSLANEHDADGDGDGVKETHVQQYYNAAGDSIYSMTTNGHLWAWSLETKGESTSGPHNYVIRDSNCDGVFDEVYSLEDKYYLPDCVKK